MATIKAHGDTDIGEISVVITGDDKVESIESSDSDVVQFLKDRIANADGYMANAYHPEAGTMLQAYASCLLLFRDREIEIDGDIGEIEFEEGVVY